MSLQLVDDEHIRVMIWAGLRPHPDGLLTWAVDTPEGRRTYQLDEQNAARVGAMLHDQNVAAYRERYDDYDDYDDGLDGVDELARDDELDGDDAPPCQQGSFHAAPQSIDWTPVELFKAVDFYVYNSFHVEEHDEAPTVEALMFCSALGRRLGPGLLGWGDISFPAALIKTLEWRAGQWGIHRQSGGRREARPT